MKQITLAEDLEKAILRGVVEGVCPATAVRPEEISKEGKIVLKATQHLLNQGAKPPLKPAAVLLVAASQGADKEQIRGYIRSFRNLDIGSDVVAVARVARSKEVLVMLINEAGEQLSSGNVDFSKLSSFIESRTASSAEEIVSLGKEIDEWGARPRGYEVKSLPKFSKILNGITGVWVVGGEPGLGKSCLAWQLALDLGDRMPILYYDIDGTGKEYFIDRTRQIVNDNLKVFKRLTGRVHLRETIRTLDADLAVVKPPALLVIDSGQTLPTSALHRRTSLDKWIVDFKGIAKRGYVVLIVSEVPRSFYGRIGMGSYKETGELEYAGSTCLQLSGDPGDSDEPIGVHVLKGRHVKAKGHVLDLERDEKKIWWFRELDTAGAEDMEDL